MSFETALTNPEVQALRLAVITAMEFAGTTSETARLAFETVAKFFYQEGEIDGMKFAVETIAPETK